MTPIRSTHRGAHGAVVANLHAGLLFLVHNLEGISDNDRRTLEQGLAAELREQTYGDWTTHLVSLFQEQLARRFGLVINGDVGEDTADALNNLLAELGAPDVGPPGPPANAISGIVRLADGSPARGIAVWAGDRHLRSERELGRARTDAAGAYRIAYSDAQIRQHERGSRD